MKVNMHEAKSQLSKLGELVWKGETVIIARAGKPWLDLLPHRAARVTRKPGLLKGQIQMPGDFDETPAELLEDFEGR